MVKGYTLFRGKTVQVRLFAQNQDSSGMLTYVIKLQSVGCIFRINISKRVLTFCKELQIFEHPFIANHKRLQLL